MREQRFYSRSVPSIGLVDAGDDKSVGELLSQTAKGKPIYEVIVRERYDLSSGEEYWSVRVSKGKLVRVFKTVGRIRNAEFVEWTDMNLLRADFMEAQSPEEAGRLALAGWKAEGYVLADLIDEASFFEKLRLEDPERIHVYYEGYVSSAEANDD